jgi:hydroxymethylpyrimidine pyrophosphatase-like HAD family hydrolase
MNNKILFADLDHTLLCDDKSISEKNRAAIQKMLERGHYFVLATGRPVESGRIVAKDLGLTSPGCYMIAFNGEYHLPLSGQPTLFCCGFSVQPDHR